MAKRKFVSSKKNAPGRAISSKEAALHRRSAGEDGAESDSGESVASSDVGSSTPLSSEDDKKDDDDEVSVSQDATPVAVEVMPASVGRGKQLRFPTAISRGKVLPTEGGAASDADDSDDESLLSVADSDGEDGVTAMDVDEQPVATSPLHIESSPTKTNSKDTPSYPIKAVRARKRHRPDSEYYKQMSTYVRDCLLSVRHAGSSDTPADVFKNESSPGHEEFRQRLATGDVERVTWKEPPSVESNSGESYGDQLSASKSSKSSKPTQSSKPSKHSKSSKSSKSSSKSKTPSSDSKVSNKSTLPSSNGSATASNITPPAQSSAPVAPSAPAMCEVCKKKMSGETSKEEEIEGSVKKKKDAKAGDVKQQPEEVKKESLQAAAAAGGYFTISFTPGSDVQKLRVESAKLMDEARKLKHEGNRRGSTERGTQGQITQGKYYLRSGAKFFEYALKLQEVKVAYQEKNDAQHAHSFGENCVTTLSQTTSLIESTIRAFQSAGSMRLAALGCKMASVVHLTVYRLQHRKLQSFYSELFTPGRSPESRENGLTPPIDPNSSSLNSNSSKDAAIRKHLLKEMEHTLRGFEMWRRYEACKVNVLPRVTNPVILDPAVFFEDLEAELSQS